MEKENVGLILVGTISGAIIVADANNKTLDLNRSLIS